MTQSEFIFMVFLIQILQATYSTLQPGRGHLVESAVPVQVASASCRNRSRMATAARRIGKELADIQKEPLTNIAVKVNENDLMTWDVLMTGPSGTPYSGGKFKLCISFGQDYPFKAPTFVFKTKAYHPNIDSDGNICLGMLKTENWKPSTKVSAILLAIYDLFSKPNPDDPLVASIAETYKNDRKEYDRAAKESTAKYAR